MKKLVYCFLLITSFYMNFSAAVSYANISKVSSLTTNIKTYITTSYIDSSNSNLNLYTKETESKISSGTILKNYNLFTEDGWQNINVLEINLKDKYTKIGLLTSSEGTGKLKNVLSMAKEAAAIAAINGDFFAGNAGKGHSIGLSINDSEIISSTANENLEKNTFSTFALNEDNDVFFDYFTNTITLTSKKTKKSIEIATINKYADNYSTPVIFTRDWGEFSLGSSEDLNLIEIVIKNNKVIEVRENKPAVEIPKKGFVVSIFKDCENAEFILKNFKKGNKVNLDISFSPDIDKIEFAISGGAKLLDEGKIPEKFSHNISGRNPRTALGTSEDGKKLYLITVDGRQVSSLGMTQTELAEFLKTLNIYNAINLDGGGSTTMVAKKPGETDLSTINNPSGGSLRSVINSIGIFSTAPKSKKIYGLNIELEDTNIFKGEEREIKVSAYNKYYNPVEIDIEDIKWNYNGVALEIKDGKVSGNTVGSCVLTASVGKVEAEIEINILSDTNELVLLPKTKIISPNEKISYTIEAKNKNGYYAKTELSTISANIIEFYSNGEKQDCIPEDAKLENFQFTAKTPGEYILAFSKGNITSYAQVSVGSQTQKDLKVRLPNDIKLEDSTNTKPENDETFKIALLDTIHEPKLMIDSLRNSNLIRSVNQNVDLTIFTENVSDEFKKNISTKTWVKKDYDLQEMKNATLINLDISNNSIRKTDASQWINLQYDIRDSEKNNIIIILNNSIDEFEDIKERNLFVDMLCELQRETKKTITVLHKGFTTDYSMERGVKFLGINTYNISAKNIADEFGYFLISITENNVSYEFKKIF